MSQSARRFSFALVLGSAFLASAAPAQSVVTGTDPCPPKLMCSSGQSTSQASTATTTTPKAATATASSSTSSSTSATVQTLLVLLGLS
jgi:hypothetical protein